MFNTIRPYLSLYRSQLGWLLLGLILTISGLLASMVLLTLSGWFLAGSAIAGIIGFSTFNYLLPAAFVRGSAITRTAARYFERVVTHEATFRLIATLRVYVFSKIFPLYPQNMSQYRQADLLNRLVSDVDTIDQLYLRILSPFIGSLITTFILVFILSWFNLNLALFLGSVVLFLLIVLPPIFYHLGKKNSDRITQLKSGYRSEINRCLQGQQVLTIYGEWDKLTEELERIDKTRLQCEVSQIKQTSLATALITMISGITICLVLYFVGSWVNESAPIITDTLALPDLLTTNEAEKSLFSRYSQTDVVFSAFAALFTFAALSVFEMLIPISHAFNHLGLVVASAERLNKLTNQSPSIQFKRNDLEETESKASSTDHSNENSNQSAVIEFNSIQFAYPEQPLTVLNDLNFSVEKYKRVAILGATGAGKSTIFQLLTRAYDPQQGSITIIGKPVKDYSEVDLRSVLAVVPQKTMLFSATLRENLLLARSKYSETITDNYLHSVLKQVGLGYLISHTTTEDITSRNENLDELDELNENDETTEHKKNSLESWLGDGGRQLSGGELRRMGLARAIIHNGPIWLLDEPTEGLDSQTEADILSLIFRLTEQAKTVLMITHRLTSIEKFDTVYTLNNKQLCQKIN